MRGASRRTRSPAYAVCSMKRTTALGDDSAAEHVQEVRWLTVRASVEVDRLGVLAFDGDADGRDVRVLARAARVLAAPALLLRDCVYRRGVGACLGLLDHLPDVLVV